MVSSATELNKDLNKGGILKTSNSNNAFDFKYEPRITDLFEIKEVSEFTSLEEHPREYLNKKISFKFNNRKWAFYRYPFRYIYKQMEKLCWVTLKHYWQFFAVSF